MAIFKKMCTEKQENRSLYDLRLKSAKKRTRSVLEGVNNNCTEEQETIGNRSLDDLRLKSAKKRSRSVLDGVHHNSTEEQETIVNRSLDDLHLKSAKRRSRSVLEGVNNNCAEEQETIGNRSLDNLHLKSATKKSRSVLDGVNHNSAEEQETTRNRSLDDVHLESAKTRKESVKDGFNNICKEEQEIIGNKSLDDIHLKSAKPIKESVKNSFNNICTKEQEIRVRGYLDDLPYDILIYIHNKLNFGDQVRFRAVCKNFRIPSNVISCSYPLPWALKLTWMNPTLVPDKYPFECELFDPYSQKVHHIWNFIREYKDLTNDFLRKKSYASKHGWLLLGAIGECSILFLHNPFTNEVIMLPHLHYVCKAATFTTDPTLPECEILVLCVPRYRITGPLYVGRYCLYKDKRWSFKYLGKPKKEILSVYCMNEELYCLFWGGMLKSYNLITQSWNMLVLSLPEPYTHDTWVKYWLVRKERDLMMICQNFENQIREWVIFTIDWFTMTWVLETSLKNVAFFVSGDISFMAPLVHDKGKTIDDCMVFCPDYKFHYVGREDCSYGRLITCYSLEKKEEVEPKEYSSWINNSSNMYSVCFIQPPCIRN